MTFNVECVVRKLQLRLSTTMSSQEQKSRPRGGVKVDSKSQSMAGGIFGRCTQNGEHT